MKFAPLLLLAACGSSSTPPAKPVTDATIAHRFTIGAWDAYSLVDGTIELPTNEFVKDQPEAADVLAAAGASRDVVHLDIHPLAVVLGKRVLLFDSGAGTAPFAKAGKIRTSLASANLRPDQVTDIFLSHAHGDHILGLVDGTTLVYPNATIHVSKPEWDVWQASEEDKAIVAAIKENVVAFEPGAQIMPEVTAVDTRGHTPGHSSYLIGNELLYVGDLVHHSVLSVQRPAWSISFDHDPPAAEAMRQRTLEKLAADHTRIFAVHFPFPGIGHIEKAGDGLVWKPE